jgi:hypothetical protein
MSHEDRSLIVAMVAYVLAVLGIFGLFWASASYFESRSYNRLAGASTTTWDAMWLELRVNGESQ